MRNIYKVSKKTVSLVWHAKHMVTHFLLGTGWYLIIDAIMPDVKPVHLLLALFASVFPDIEHLYYWFLKKPHTTYAAQIIKLIRTRKIVELVQFVAHKHKFETFLPFHHIVTPIVGTIFCISALRTDRTTTAVFMGAFILHYVFDIVEDFVLLRRLNPNWTASPISRLRKKA